MMFGIDFYPTPEKVIAEILQCSIIANKTILEPSAGSGNIVRFLKSQGAKEVIGCEIDSKLRRIVEKECRIIKDDFLTVTSDEISHVDMIVMNPPFSKQEEHIMHAWDICPDGCEIVSLCNSSLLNNAYSEARRGINDLIKFHGKSELLGDVFSESERKTSVEVSCIYLYKPASDENDFSDYFDLNEEYEKSDVAGIVSYDFVRDIVNRFVGAVREYDKVLESAITMNHLVNGYMSDKLTFTCTIKEAPVAKATFAKELQKCMWKSIFNKFNMNKYVTRGVMADINKFVEQQTHVPFTMKNIYLMIQMIAGTRGSRMDKVIVEAFENICSFAYENSTAGEKWKTNSDYMVNKKFIVPWGTRYESKYDDGYVRLSYSSKYFDMIDDIIKALCYLSGVNYDELTFKPKNGYSDKQPIRFYYYVTDSTYPWGEWFDFTPFFRVKCYKKGTIHFEFKDEDVWAKFNIKVAEIKGWRLPTAKAKRERKQETGIEIF